MQAPIEISEPENRHYKTTAHTGAVTLIQRFGSVLNLNIHFQSLFLNVVHVVNCCPSLASSD
jgi:hypothetical protein